MCPALGTARPHSARLDPLGSARSHSARLGLTRFGPAPLGLARPYSAWLGLTRFGLAPLGAARPPPALFSTDRPRSAVLGNCEPHKFLLSKFKFNITNTDTSHGKYSMFGKIRAVKSNKALYLSYYIRDVILSKIDFQLMMTYRNESKFQPRAGINASFVSTKRIREAGTGPHRDDKL